jgi:serine/threonine protein kinase
MSESIGQGTVIGGKYELEEKIGEGGFGRVWKGRQISNGRQLAVKQPVYEGAPRQKIDEYFERERDALREISNQGGHPSIMSLVEDVDHNGSLFLVLGLVSGEEFQDYIETRGTMTDDEVRQFGITLCDAMSFLHEEIEYMYRDLKPDNILVDSNGDPTIIDFTTAREYDEDAGTSKTGAGGRSVDPDQTVIRGDTKYKPPELLGNSPFVHGPQIDVYSIGKILYKARINWAPESHGQGPKSNDSSVATYLDQIIVKATQEKASERYRSATALKRALENRDATPPKRATLTRVSNGDEHSIEPGETIGRKGDGPPTNIAIDDDYVSKVHCRVDLDTRGNWVLRDKSTNGTYVYRPSRNEWMYFLSEKGQQRLRDANHADRVDEANGKSCNLQDGDTIALVDPEYKQDSWSWFKFSEK